MPPERTLLDLIDTLGRRKRLLFGLPLAVMLSAVLVSLVLPKRYTVESRFMPETGGSNVSRLAGLAAQFGVDVGGMGGESGESVDFYAELLESQDLLREAALSTFSFTTKSGEPKQGTLVELLEAKGDDEDERIKATVEKLDALVTVTPDPGAELVTVKASAPWPALAVDLNRRLLDLVSEFNVERRQSRAIAEREFLEGRVAEAEAELREAEQRLARFLNENRAWDESPQLSFEHARMQRRLDVLQQVYASLAQGFEQARVDEVRNTPLITILDQPRPPAERTFPNYVINALLGLVLGGLLALGIVAWEELRRESSQLRRTASSRESEAAAS